MDALALVVMVGVQLSTPTAVSAVAAIQPPRAPAPIERPAVAPLVREGAEVTFYNVNTRETDTFFLPVDGALDHQDETRLMHMFRCKRSGHEHSVDQGLVQILARIGQRFPGHVFELVSAHRAQGYGVRDSKHFSGQAADIRLRGVSLVDVRTFVWAELATQMPIGLGHYHGEKFLHVDHRPGEPSIAWDQTRRNRSYRYNPRWSRTAASPNS